MVSIYSLLDNAPNYLDSWVQCPKEKHLYFEVFYAVRADTMTFCKNVN